MAGRAERWDRDRFMYERERDRGYPDDRAPRFPDERSRFEERDDYHPRPAVVETTQMSASTGAPMTVDTAAATMTTLDRRYVEEDRYGPRRGEPLDREFDRRLFFEKEPVPKREFREPSPVRRPTMVRRQSSLDTFDRRPLRFYEREEYPPPARREDVRPRDPRDDYRAPPYVPIPLPAPGSWRYDEIQIAEPGYYGDEEFRGMPERVKEREVVTSRRRRDRSRESRVSRSTRKSSHRSSSRSSSTSSRTTSSSRSATTIRSAYPKKGKTRIPARLVSKRALIDLGYPYIEEGNTVIVLKALGQENIDELLKLSEEYKQSELEVAAARSSAAHLVDERHEEIYTIPPPAAALPPPPPAAQVPPPPPPASVAPPPAPPTVVAAPAPAPTVIYEAAPPPPAPAPVEVVNKTTIIRDVSPARSTTSYTTSTAPTVYERREYSEEVPIGPMAVAERRRSRSRSRKDIRSEIKALEAQLHDRRRHGNRELVRAEQMPDGAVVLFEEKVEKIEEPRRGVRIEKDKKGRMAISVPKYY
ncbi:LOW QUALITY PROTEIN: hypothetical protein Ct61P_11710 [Colletotrichum tofieldiae]|nr:LOW QUALITY PROTEIN: hypothetical protein Ct61P_11710 [Colletotrichum tofieldiae]